MSSPAIFLYGLAVTAIVAAACYLVVRGIIEDRRDRADIDAHIPPSGPVVTGADARTVEVDRHREAQA